MKKSLSRTLSFLLACCLCLSLFASAAPQAAAEDGSAPGQTEQEPDRSLSWSKAFGDDSLPEGSLTPEEIAFFQTDDEGKPGIENVPKEEVLAWWNEQESLPRTRYFEQFMPEKLQDLYPLLDYAFAHSCSRFCVPSTTFTATDVAGGWKYLPLTYRINNNGISTLTPAVFDLGGGKALQYVTVTIKGMDKQGVMSEYQESLAAAREIVAGIPEGSSEYDKALYLYRWLTDNVKYFSAGEALEYYDTEWNLLYDTLVRKDTVCAGYAEALYVLYNLAGIECFTISGAIYSNGEWGGHIWNVAKVDGIYYQFDATWDTGVQPEFYCFFGVSEETMQSYYPRLLMGDPQSYCPPCTEDLPLPDGASVMPEELRPGAMEDGAFSQPYFDLGLTVDDSWKIWSREEINEEYYGGIDYSLEKLFRLGGIYTDLAVTRGEDDGVEVWIERGPLVSWKGVKCDGTESYLDTVAREMPEILAEEYGMEDPAVRRFRTEICGRSYEALTATGTTDGELSSKAYYCTERDGCFLTINIYATGKTAEEILQELLGEEPDPLAGITLSWARAFRSSKLPEGSFTGAEIAFYVPDDQGGAGIVNVSKKEVLRWWNEQESLPRTRFYEQFMPEELAELYPVLDYAMAYGYSRASVPTTAFCGQDVAFAAKYLRLTYRINDSGIGGLSVASFDLEDGQTLDFVLVTLPGMDARGRMSEYRESVAAAREIVAGMPEGLSEYDKALCLYNWLTENVRYDYDDYYDGQWTLLYDALVKKRTVCAGYAEALYVLYNLAGIECFTVEGFLNSPDGAGSHIWNVARIDGDYYQFDATWDEGVAPEGYRFFGVSEETLQSYYQRHVETLAEEYCPPCTKDLPLPEDWSSPLFDTLNPGSVRNGVYSQPYFDLTLCPDESWTVYSREEIISSYYMGMDLSMEMMLSMGLPYLDLVMERKKDLVQIILEPSPVQTGNGEISEDAKSYMDNVALTLPEVLSSTGVKNAAVTRYRTEICGRSYEALNLTSKSGWTRVNQTYYCTERDGVFLTIIIASSGSGDCDDLLAELLGS